MYAEDVTAGIVAYVDTYSSTKKSYIYNCYSASEVYESTNNKVAVFSGQTNYMVADYALFQSGYSVMYSSNNDSTGVNYGIYTLEQMKTQNSGALTILLKERGNGIWAQSSSINKGYPYLKDNQP